MSSVMRAMHLIEMKNHLAESNNFHRNGHKDHECSREEQVVLSEVCTEVQSEEDTLPTEVAAVPTLAPGMMPSRGHTGPIARTWCPP